MLFWAPGAQFLKIRENRHGNGLGSRGPSFQNVGLQSSSDPPPFGGLVIIDKKIKQEDIMWIGNFLEFS